jgi:probable phosphoglycerate mutase
VSDASDLTRVVLVRHGESNSTIGRFIAGHRTCAGLSDLGRRQAERLRDRLASTGEVVAEVLIASNFARAVETAEIIAVGLGDPEVEIDAGFGEHDPGPDIDGMRFDAYVDRFGAPDWTDPDLDVFPGGETVGQFHARVAAALDRVTAAHQGRKIVVSCHGGVIDAAFRSLLRLPTVGAFQLQTLNTSITEFAQLDDGTWRLERYNDAAHLHGLPAATPRLA